MRRYRSEFAFFLCALVTGMLAYLALLGDSGLWRRNDLYRDLQHLEQSVDMLRQENGVLFARLHGATPRRSSSAGADGGRDLWVLKFEGSPESNGARLVRPEERMSLAEARILFGVGFVLFLLVGLYFTATMMRNRTVVREVVSDKGVRET